MTVNINMTAVLECAAEGVPTPRVAWRKDGTLFAGNSARYLLMARRNKNSAVPSMMCP